MAPETLDALRAQHGPLTIVKDDEHAAAFRAMTPAEVQALEARVRSLPDLSYQLAVDACLTCLVSERADFDALLETWPLAFDLDDKGLCGKLAAAATATATGEVNAAVARWRGAERQLGRAAQHLLAFKAYTGGPPSADAMAGALAVAEGLDTLKGLFKLHYSFFKALSRG